MPSRLKVVSARQKAQIAETEAAAQRKVLLAYGVEVEEAIQHRRIEAAEAELQRAEELQVERRRLVVEAAERRRLEQKAEEAAARRAQAWQQELQEVALRLAAWAPRFSAWKAAHARLQAAVDKRELTALREAVRDSVGLAGLAAAQALLQELEREAAEAAERERVAAEERRKAEEAAAAARWAARWAEQLRAAVANGELAALRATIDEARAAGFAGPDLAIAGEAAAELEAAAERERLRAEEEAAAAAAAERERIRAEAEAAAAAAAERERIRAEEEAAAAAAAERERIRAEEEAAAAAAAERERIRAAEEAAAAAAAELERIRAEEEAAAAAAAGRERLRAEEEAAAAAAAERERLRVEEEAAAAAAERAEEEERLRAEEEAAAAAAEQEWLRAEAEAAAAAAEAAAAAKKPWEGAVEPLQPFPDFLFAAFPKPVVQQRITPKVLEKVSAQNLPGEFYGILFPHSPEQIQEMGPKWLTEALHKAGTLSPEVDVESFTNFRVLAGDTTKVTKNADDSNWGGAGIKVLLSVKYSGPVVDTANDFFIKLPHKMGGKSERHKVSVLINNDFPEVTFNALLAERAPFRCPRCYFADMNRETTNFIVVQERLDYAAPGRKSYEPEELLPPPGKYLDYKLETKGADHYYAAARAYARMAAWYQASAQLSSQLDYLFMPKEQADHWQQKWQSDTASWGSIHARLETLRAYVQSVGPEAMMGICEGHRGMDVRLMNGVLEIGMNFLEQSKNLYPKGFLTSRFKEKLESELKDWMAHAGLCNWVISECFFDLTVLSHPNLQIDNAFYWRDHDRQMYAGLLDFGSVQHLPIPHVLSGGWGGAEVEVMDEHEDKLCGFFADELTAFGGTCCDRETFTLLVKLSRGSNFLGMFVNCAKLFQLVPTKEFCQIKSRHDPRLEGAFLPRCYGVGPVLSIQGWKKRDPTPYLHKLKQLIGMV